MAWSEFAAHARQACNDFEFAASNPRAAQTQRLQSIVQNNRACAFGEQFDFCKVDGVDRFRAHVPIQDWSALAPWVRRAQHENTPVLTAERPLFFERTSGSNALVKHIPYTRRFLEEFQRSLVVWLSWMYEARPGIGDGPGYWSLSPIGEAPTAAANGIAIGNASDAIYLQGSSAERLLETLVSVAFDTDESDQDWKLKTARVLAGAESLALISVWSPSFLTAVLAPLVNTNYRDFICEALPPKRCLLLDRALAAGRFDTLWPRLAVVSCWMDGSSRSQSDRLRQWFPSTEFVPKGLVATEGIVSFPVGLSGRSVLAIQSHFLEFVDDSGDIRLVDELALGKTYRPVLTTSGGLYRYRLGDVVEVDGWFRETPTVRFVGREDSRSDLVGEKLDEALVARALDLALGPEVGAFMIPMPTDPARYLIGIADSVALNDTDVEQRVEAHLSEIFHYAQARRIGQLQPLVVRRYADP